MNKWLIGVWVLWLFVACLGYLIVSPHLQARESYMKRQGENPTAYHLGGVQIGEREADGYVVEGVAASAMFILLTSAAMKFGARPKT